MTDQTNYGVQSALIAITNNSYEFISFSETDSMGHFTLPGSYKQSKYLIVRHLNFHTDTLKILEETEFYNIVLKARSFQLQEVHIKSNRAAYRTNNDTTRFRTTAFSDSTEQTVEALLSKLPGVKIDDSGTISFRGKTVSRVLLEKDDLFGNKYAMGTKSMSPAYVEEFEFIDHYIEEELFQNIVDSDELVLNIKLSKKVNLSIFGGIEAGGGTSKKYLTNNNLFNLAGKHKGTMFNKINNIGFGNFIISQYLDLKQNFDKLNYNRSNLPILFEATPFQEGVSKDLQSRSKNFYLIQNNVFRFNRLKVNFNMEAVGLKMESARRVSTAYINNYGEIDEFSSIRNKLTRISPFIEASLSLNSFSKLKFRYTNVYDNRNSNTDKMIRIDTENQLINYNTPLKTRFNKYNLEYLKKLNGTTLLILNYSGIFENIEESVINQNLSPGIDSNLFLGNFEEEFTQNIKDHAIEVRLANGKVNRKRYLSIGFNALNDLLSSNISSESQESLDIIQLYNRNNLEYFLEFSQSDQKGKFSWRNKARATYSSILEKQSQESGKMGYLLYNLFSSLHFNPTPKISTELNISFNSRISPVDQSSGFLYYNSFRSSARWNNELDVFHQIFGIWSFKISKPSSLLEFYGNIYCNKYNVYKKTNSLDAYVENSEFHGRTDQQNIGLQFHMDKYLSKLSSNLYMHYSFSVSDIKSGFQSIPEFTQRSHFFKSNLSTNVFDYFAFSLSLSTRYSIIKAKEVTQTKSVNHTLFSTASAGFEIFPFGTSKLKLELTMKSAYMPENEIHFFDNFQLDTYMSYNINNRWDVRLQVRNLLNLEAVNYNFINTYSMQSFQIKTQPLFATISFSRQLTPNR